MNRPDGLLVCIGGHADGQRHACNHAATQIAEMPTSLTPIWQNVPIDANMTVSVYHRETLHVNGVKFYFWRYDGLTTADAIARLLQGYRKP